MSASAVIGGKELILVDWRVLAVCSGLNFETGGTMNVSVYFDPDLDPELRAPLPSAEEYTKYFSDPETIALAMKQAQPGIRRSSQIRQILALDFSSRDHDPYFDWVLSQKIDKLLPQTVRAVEEMGRSRSEGTQFLAELLSNLGKLDDWSQLNRRRFSSYRLLVDPEVAEALSLTSESAAEHHDEFVTIFRSRIA